MPPCLRGEDGDDVRAGHHQRSDRRRDPRPRGDRHPDAAADLARLPAALAPARQPAASTPGSAATASATQLAAVGVGPGSRRPLPLQRPRVPRGHDRRATRRASRRSTSTTATSRTSCATCSRDAQTRGHHLPRQLRAAAGARCCRSCRRMALLLQVDDGSGEPLLPGARDYEAGAGRGERRAAAGDADRGRPLHPLHRRHDRHAEGRAVAPGRHLLRRAWAGSCPAAWARCRASTRWSSARRTAPCIRIAAGAAVHARRGALVGVHHPAPGRHRSCCRATRARSIPTTSGARSSASASARCRSSATPSRGRCSISCGKGSLRPLERCSILGSGGAILSPPLKQAFLEALPDLMIFDGFGSSETGAQGATLTTAGDAVRDRRSRWTTDTCRARRGAHAPARRRARTRSAGSRAPATCRSAISATRPRRSRPIRPSAACATPCPATARRSPPTAASVVFGRDSVCINSGGEKIFAEEVEQALKHHPAVYDVVVAGTPSERWGEQVTAVVAAPPRRSAPADDELRETAAKHLARYKLPKAFVFVDADRARAERQARLPLGEVDRHRRGVTHRAGCSTGGARMPRRHPPPALEHDAERRRRTRASCRSSRASNGSPSRLLRSCGDGEHRRRVGRRCGTQRMLRVR